MKSEIFWLIQKQVLYWKISGNLPGTEIAEMSHFIVEQVGKSSSQKVHLIIDGMGIESLEYTNQAARDAFQALAKKAWMGKVIAMTRNYQIQVHINALSSAFGLNWQNVNSMEEAVRALKKGDNLLHTIPTAPVGPAIVRPKSKVSSN
jgi:hypothetical protein